MTTWDPRRRVALALSLATYLVPVITVHWVGLLGLALVQGLASDKPWAWKATEFGAALVAQGVLGVAAFAGLRRGVLAGVLVTAVTWVPLAVALNAAYLWAIPTVFLIETDRTPDVNLWTEHCVVDGGLAAVRAGVSRSVERRGEVLVQSGPDARSYAWLRVPDCTLDAILLPTIVDVIGPDVVQAVPDGAVLYRATPRGGSERYWLLARGEREPRVLLRPEGSELVPPVVSEDGGWVAWLLRGPARTRSVRLEPLGGGEAVVFDHALLRGATIALEEVDMIRREITVSRDLDTFVTLRLDGGVAWGPHTPPVAAQPGTLRRVGDGWAAWDAYVEHARYRLVWRTAAGSGEYTVPKGRGVTDATADVHGAHVAVSTTTALSLGQIGDTVLAIRVRDGAEMFRRSLPTYTRSQVAFVGDGFFAYSEVHEGRASTRVLRMTE